MDLKTKKIDKYLMAIINEGISIRNVTEVEQEITGYVEKGYLHLVINITNPDHACSLFVSVLVRLCKKLQNLNGSISIISPNPDITHSLIICGIHKLMPLYNSEGTFSHLINSTDQTADIYFTIRFRGKFTVIDIKKPISIIAGYQPLVNELKNQLKNGTRFIAFDLNNIEEIYSEMIGLLKKFNNDIRALEGELRLMGLQETLKERLALVGFDKIVTFCDSEADLD